jgi:protein SCO1/2
LMDPEGKFCDFTTKEFIWNETYTKLLRRMVDYGDQKVLERQQAEEKKKKEGKK